MIIYDLNKIPQDKLDLVGGKAKGLNLLIVKGFSVPHGFIVMDAIEEKDFLEAYEYYLKSDISLKKVAIRSSATIEDGENFSNAGQYDTILNVSTKEEFIKGMKDCIASLNNNRSKAYAETFLNASENKMTLVIQEMVEAKYAGVLFTRDPLQQSKVLIECVNGLGESLVSGEKSAEQYRVDKDNVVEMEDNTSLDKDTVIKMALEARKLEEQFNAPMDVEWAINESGKLLFLQSRPITTLSDEGCTLSEFDFPYDVTDYTITTCNVKEMLPNAVTPLTLSSSAWCLDYGMRKMMEQCHAVKKVTDLPPFSCITPFYNNLFFNQTTNYINAYKIIGFSKESSDLSICGRVLDEFPDKFANYSNNFIRAINLLHFIPFIVNDKKTKKGVDEAIGKIWFDYNLPKEELFKQTEDFFSSLGDVFYYHYAASYYSGAAQASMHNMIKDAVKDPLKIDVLQSGILTNIEGIESAKILNELMDIGKEFIKAYPSNKPYTTEEIVSILSNDDGKTKELYDTFITKHGHRGMMEIELRSRVWGDDINDFAEFFKGVLVACTQKENLNKKTWKDYYNEALSYISPKKQKKFEDAVNKARHGVSLREYTKSRCAKAVSKYRIAYRTIAKELEKEGLLTDVDLIFFLTRQEIGQLLKGDKMVVKKAIKRRRLYPIQCAMKFEEVYCGRPKPIKEEIAYEGKTSLQGSPASPGKCEGRVHIVTSIEEANTLKPGEIMVAETVDVGYTPYFCSAAGLITEIGSCLSHGVVVAREYGLPTVVNVKGALKSLKNGDLISMDATNGKIIVKESEK